MERILYSEISNFVFGLDVPGRGVFATNIEKLLLYVLDDENTVNEDCKKLTIKIYDHFQLALCQIENVNNIALILFMYLCLFDVFLSFLIASPPLHLNLYFLRVTTEKLVL